MDNKVNDMQIDIVRRYIKKYGIDKNILNFKKEVLQMGTIADCIKTAENFPELGVNEFQDRIINSNHGYAMVEFAKRVNGANITKLEDAVVVLKIVPYLYIFAKDVASANINRLQKEVIKSGNVDIMEHFANDIKGANKQLIYKTINQIKASQKEFSK